MYHTAPGDLMTDITANGWTASRARAIAIQFSILQLLFTLGWVAYAIYLPQLGDAVGLAAGTVTLILMADQATFAAMNVAMGVAADRIAARAGRLGLFIAVLTGLSCVAFVALPYLAGEGPAVRFWFVVALVVWVMASSVLRAAPAKLLGRHAAKPDLPSLAALVTFGYGLASAATPYVGLVLRDVDAELPFIISSVALLAAVIGLSSLEQRAPPQTRPETVSPPGLATLSLFAVAMAILAIGFELQMNIVVSPLLARVVGPNEVAWFSPLFWLGFNVVIVPVGLMSRRLGALTVTGAAAIVGAAAMTGMIVADAFMPLIVMHVIAGAAWGSIVSSAVAAALVIGRGVAEGVMAGLAYSALALGTFIRMIVAAGLGMLDDVGMISWAPPMLWLIGGAALLVLAASRSPQAGKVQAGA